MRTLIAILFLIGMAGAISGPAGIVQNANQADTPEIALSGVNASVFNTTELSNDGLGQPHYIWDRTMINQSTGPTEVNLKNWSDQWVAFPKSFVRR